MISMYCFHRGRNHYEVENFFNSLELSLHLQYHCADGKNILFLVERERERLSYNGQSAVKSRKIETEHTQKPYEIRNFLCNLETKVKSPAYNII